jgi:hypothetical protein
MPGMPDSRARPNSPRSTTDIFRNPAAEAAQQMLGPSEPPGAAIAARVRLMWAMGATSKFIWPIPDKGLKKRIHRVSAPTLIVWGADDRLVPSIYADDFSKRLAHARVHIIDRERLAQMASGLATLVACSDAACAGVRRTLRWRGQSLANRSLKGQKFPASWEFAGNFVLIAPDHLDEVRL